MIRIVEGRSWLSLINSKVLFIIPKHHKCCSCLTVKGTERHVLVILSRNTEENYPEDGCIPEGDLYTLIFIDIFNLDYSVFGPYLY